MEDSTMKYALPLGLTLAILALALGAFYLVRHLTAGVTLPFAVHEWGPYAAGVIVALLPALFAPVRRRMRVG
jgi:membrane protein implicated in regulation of membrane protease activity